MNEPVGASAVSASAQRLYRSAKEQVHFTWSMPAFQRLGRTIRRALIAEAVLHVLDTQDASIPAERRVALLHEMTALAIHDNDL